MPQNSFQEARIIFDNIEVMLNIPIKFSGVYYRPLNNLQDSKPKSKSHASITRLDDAGKEFGTLLNEIFGWFGANPSKPNTVIRGNESYVYHVVNISHEDEEQDQQYWHDITANRIINDETLPPSERIYRIEEVILNNVLKTFDDDTICEKNIIKSSTNIVIEGNRGIGKTTFFNHWLNNRSHILDSNKILWFRIDASKIYDVWNLNLVGTADPKLFLLDRYHRIHTVYVITKYGISPKSGKAIRDTWEFIDNLSRDDKELQGFFQECRAIHKAIESYNDGKSTEEFIRWVLGRESLYRSIKLIYALCTEYWASNNSKIMLIIDGLDNIPRVNPGDLYYDRLLRDAGTLFTGGIPSSIKKDLDCIVLVLRPETYHDLLKICKLPNRNSAPNNIYEMIVAPTCFYSIITHKAGIIEEPLCDEFKYLCAKYEKAESVSSSKPKKISKEFQDFAKDYMQKLSTSIKERYLKLEALDNHSPVFYRSKNFDDYPSLLSILYNSNLRSSSFNFLSTYFSISYLDQKKVPGAKSHSRYMQYLFLNGKMFLDSPNTDCDDKGAIFPNIFWWDQNRDDCKSANWYGLIGLRILQLLKFHIIISEKALRLIMTSCFSIKDSFFAYQMKRMLRYGLIEYKLMSNSDHDIQYAMTSKGKFFIDYMFMYSYWIYLSALDTPLDKDYNIDNDTRYIKFHRHPHNFDFIELFNVAFVTTTITFFRHIITQHELEISNIENTWNNLDRSQFEILSSYSLEKFISIFEFPNHFIPLYRSDFEHMFNNLSRNKLKLVDLYKDILGLYKKYFIEK